MLGRTGRKRSHGSRCRWPLYVPAAHGSVMLQLSSLSDNNTHTAFVREHREKVFYGCALSVRVMCCMFKKEEEVLVRLKLSSAQG